MTPISFLAVKIVYTHRLSLAYLFFKDCFQESNCAFRSFFRSSSFSFTRQLYPEHGQMTNSDFFF